MKARPHDPCCLLTGLLLLCAQVTLSQNELFISEYLESTHNKCIELFNPTNHAITLDGSYSLKIGYNGNAAPTTLCLLNGTIQPKSTFVVCSASTPFTKQDQWGVGGHNGNDALILEKNGSPLDIFGNVGCDPGSAWTQGGNSSEDQTLVRRGCITQGVSSDPGGNCPFPTLGSEWISMAPGSAHLGTHGFLYGLDDVIATQPTACGSSDGTITVLANGSELEYSFDGGISFQSESQMTGLTAGTYEIIVRVQLDPDCALTTTATLMAPEPPQIEQVILTHPDDCQSAKGSIEIIASGGNLEYSIDDGNNYHSNAIFSNLPAGNYALIMRTMGSSTCLDNEQVQLLDPQRPTLQLLEINHVTCQGFANGSIEVVAGNGSGQYDYHWPGINIHSSRVEDLEPGSYEVIVSDQQSPSCKDTISHLVIQEPLESPPPVLLDPLEDLCQTSPVMLLDTIEHGITGHWEGEGVDGNVFDPFLLSGEVILSFHPSPGQCFSSSEVTQNVLVPEPVQLSLLQSLCGNHDPIWLDPIPSGVAGTWTGPGVTGQYFDPEGLEGLKMLLFSPDSAECALNTSFSININSPFETEVDNPGEICASADPVLLNPYQDGVMGTWLGSGVEDNQFHPSGLVGPVDLTFNPTEDQCALSVQTTIYVVEEVVTQFDIPSETCANGSIIDLQSFQGDIDGDWSGAGVTQNQFNPDELEGEFLLTFYPAPEQCRSRFSHWIEVEASIEVELNTPETVCLDDLPLKLETDQGNINGNWSGPALENDWFAPATPGIYDLLFRPMNDQCAISSQHQITVHDIPTFHMEYEEPSCHGALDGFISIVPKVEETLGFSWFKDDIHLEGNVAERDGLGRGSYSIRMENKTGCQGVASVTLSEPEPIRSSIVTIDTTFDTAELKAEVYGGTPPYQYFWSNGSEQSSTSVPRPYQALLKVTDAHGCTDSALLYIPERPCNLKVKIKVTEEICQDSYEGSIDLQVSSSKLPLKFQWEHDPLLNSGTLTGLQSGQYQVTITDQAGCEVQEEMVIHSLPPIKMDAFVTEVTFPESGSIEIKASGGIAPYTYRWSTGDQAATIEQLQSGWYTVTVTDNVGCQVEESFFVDSTGCSLQASTTLKPGCTGQDNGSAEISTENNSGVITYHWSHSPTLHAARADHLSAGNYQVTVSDESGCVRILHFAMEPRDTPHISFEKSDASASFPMDGWIKVHTAGSNALYDFIWNTGSTSDSIGNLVPGIYNVTVTDASKCASSGSVEIISRECTLHPVIEVKNPKCAGEETGSIYLDRSYFSDNLAVSWSHDATLNSHFAEGLPAGEYVLSIEEGKCQWQDSFRLTAPDPLAVNFTLGHVTSPGRHDGWINAKGMGGNAPYTYSWNIGTDSENLTSLAPGMYSLTLTDAAGCTLTKDVVIDSFPCLWSVQTSIIQPTCYGFTNGSIELTTEGNLFDPTTLWSHDRDLRTFKAENLAAGDYQVHLVDSTGCEWTEEIQLVDPSPLEVEIELAEITAFGLDDTIATAMVRGGTPPYNYLWSNDSTGARISDLAPGTYSITVTDDSQCTDIDSVNIEDSHRCSLHLDYQFTQPSCDIKNGRIELQIEEHQGETRIEWGDGFENQMIRTNLAPGSYTVSITDDLCSTSATFLLESDTIRDVQFRLDRNLCGSGSTLLIEHVEGGQAPYSFWLDGEQVYPDIAKPSLSPGNHTLVLSDEKGCTFRESIHVQQDTLFTTTPNVTIKRGEGTLIQAQVDPSFTGTYQWTGSDGTTCSDCLELWVEPEETTRYRFEIEDLNGCKQMANVTVVVDQRNLVFIPNALTLNNDGINDEFVIYDGSDLVETIDYLAIHNQEGLTMYEGEQLRPSAPIPGLRPRLNQAIAPEVLFYITRIRFKQGFTKMYRGTIHLIR